MAPKQTDAVQIRRVAREGLGFDRLRPGQQAIVQSVLDGRDTLAVMPTGSGKSAIYQIAGVLLPGTTIVVSPLIALQVDQMEAISAQDVGGAAAVNSTLGDSERREALTDMGEDNVEFVFMAPEQFSNDEVIEHLRETSVSLFVVDEAHCISEWGHDFRPDYLRLGAVIASLDHPTVLALTATASPPVRHEIVDRLGMRAPNIVVRGFDRPNIWLGVEAFGDETAKERAIIERVLETDKPGIIYVATRKKAEEIAGLLSQNGVEVAAYHAGLPARERERIQQAFMDDALDVIVATIAFGMGIDKPNVRFVFHYHISEAVDAYYQEIGRAGRDGEPAKAILFYDPKDLGLRRFFAGSGKLEPEDARRVIAALPPDNRPASPGELQAATGLSSTKLAAAINRLAESGAIQQLPAGDVVASGNVDLEDAIQRAAEAQDHRRQYDQSRVDMMRGYAEVADCRRQFLLNYFGQELSEPCGNCDNCDAGIIAVDSAEQPFAVNSRVLHREWGFGEVMRYEGEAMVVLFDKVGYKTLATEIVVELDLLKPAD